MQLWLIEITSVYVVRFVFAIPPATVPRITMHASHVPPSSVVRQHAVDSLLCRELTPRARCLHKVTMSSAVQFPELRLIQYDCGALLCSARCLFFILWRSGYLCVIETKVLTICGDYGLKEVNWLTE